MPEQKKAPDIDKKQIDNLPNIVMIMGEAYSDLSINKHIDFSNYTDPMEEYKNYRRRRYDSRAYCCTKFWRRYF